MHLVRAEVSATISLVKQVLHVFMTGGGELVLFFAEKCVRVAWFGMRWKSESENVILHLR